MGRGTRHRLRQRESQTPSLNRALALYNATGDPRIIHWLCEQTGGFYVGNAVASAASDSKINQREARAIRREWEKLKRVAEGYVKCCEQGNFKQLNREMKMQKYLNTTRQGALPPRV